MKNETNVQFVKKTMEFSNYGALAQLFVIDAIQKQADRIAKTPIEELRKAFGENAFINPDAWHGVAKEIQAKLEARGKAA